MFEDRAKRGPEKHGSEASATPTTGRVEPQRNGGETRPGATSPYALHSFSGRFGALARNRPHLWICIRGKGWLITFVGVISRSGVSR
jgi:hypothetical protein